jgi:hypothetical protein
VGQLGAVAVRVTLPTVLACGASNHAGVHGPVFDASGGAAVDDASVADAHGHVAVTTPLLTAAVYRAGT